MMIRQQLYLRIKELKDVQPLCDKTPHYLFGSLVV